MNRNLVIVLAGGFLIAVIVAFLVSATLSGDDGEQVAVKEGPRVEIAVASKTIDVGNKLSENNMRWQEWPESAVFSAAIVRDGAEAIQDAVSGVVKRPIQEGEPIFESAIISDAGNFVSATLDKNMRAVAIEVDAASMAGGFISAGDYVDVIMTYKESIRYDGPENPEVEQMIDLNINKYASETILQNVRVLAVDQAAKRPSDEEDIEVKVGKTVTLEVDIQGAEILALAQEMGELSLALRQLGDKQVYKRNYKVVTDKRITSVAKEVYKEMSEIEKTSGQNANIVRIYNGFTLEETPVRQ